ncbi:MAG: HNH endonuclease [Aeromonadaceae bacterium]
MNVFRDTNYACDASGEILNIKTGRAIKQSVTSGGYAKVCIYHLGKRSFHYAHRVVAECMVENPSGKPEVNHIDGNKLNNNPKNLEWVTSSENQHHAFRCGLQKPTTLVGKLNGRYKGEIRYIPVSGGEEGVIRSLTDCCKHGFHGPSVHKVISGKLKTHKGHIFWRNE